MLERLLASNVRISSHITQRLAVIHGWSDLYNHEDPYDLAWAATLENAVDVLEDLYDVRRLIELSPRHAVDAACKGRLETVRWLQQRMPSERWPTSVMDHAADSGNLDLVIWLHDNSPVGCTSNAIDRAAEKGHLHIIVWLANNRNEGCSVLAFKHASKSVSAEMLEFLRQRYPEVYLRTDDYTYQEATHLEVLKWIEQHRPSLPLERLLPQVIKAGNAETLEWLTGKTAVQFGPEVLHAAIEDNHAALAAWLVRTKDLEIDAWMFESGKHGKNTPTLA
nr:hypothetical protein HK105_001656 [Polyrhizophydium stewartii]